MRIVVVGTSNSVMGNKGFLESLRLEHEVIQLSCGRVPFFFHLRTLISHMDLIESCDLLIIDHYVNDVNFYHSKLGFEYEKLCHEFYNFLSTLNINVINILFPIQGLGVNFSKYYYELVLSLCDLNSISVIDLNKLDFKAHHFQDVLHLSHDVSYAFGIVLAGILNNKAHDFKLLRPFGGMCKKNPFYLVDLARSNNLETNIFKNSLIELKYVDVKNNILIKTDKGHRLLSVGFLRPKSSFGLSGMIINNINRVALDGIGYSHEALDFDVFGDVNISPIFSESTTEKNLMGRKESKGSFTYLYLVDLLFHSGSEMEFSPAKRKVLDFDVSNTINLANRLFKKPSAENKFHDLLPRTVDKIRDMAIDIESKDIEIAKDLMRIAYLARPNGPFIKKKLEEYESLIK